MELLIKALYLLGAGVAVFFLVRLGYWYYQGWKLKESGYMPPPSPKIARMVYKAVGAVFTRIFVGPMTKIGKANEIFIGRGAVLPNHVVWTDFAVVAKAISFSYRQIAKYGEIKMFVIRTIAAWIGTVGVQVEGGKTQDGAGQLIVDTGAKILEASFGSRLLVFSQGKLCYSGTCEPNDFRTGSSRMLLQALENIGNDPMFALPVAIHYIRDAALATPFQRFLYACGLKYLRTRTWKEEIRGTNGKLIKTIKHKFVVYGVVVVIGEPIPAASLPKDPRAAIEMVRQSIEANLALAVAESEKRRPAIAA